MIVILLKNIQIVIMFMRVNTNSLQIFFFCFFVLIDLVNFVNFLLVSIQKSGFLFKQMCFLFLIQLGM